MSVQTSVLDNYPLSAPGVLQGSPIATNTRVAEVAIQAGLFVCQGTADGQCKLPASSGDCAKGLGIAPAFPANDSRFPSGGTAGVTYQIGDTVEAVIGQAWVTVEEDVVAQDAVYVRYATGTGSQKGAFRKTADSSTAAAVTGARYLTSASAGGLALVAVNLPQ